MKILDISSFYSDNGGGVRTYHQQKLTYFANASEHRYVMVISGSKWSKTVLPGGTVYRIKGFPVSKNADYRQICDFNALRNILACEKPDVIEIGSIYLDNWLALFGTLFRDITRVALYHADFPDSYLAPAVEGFPKPFAKGFVRFWHKYVNFACAQMDATCVTSGYIRNKLTRMGIDNIIQVPLGVDTTVFDRVHRDTTVRAELGIGASDICLLYVGRFSTEKGIETMLAALPSICSDTQRKIVLVGGGPLESQVRQKTAHLKNVQVLPFVKDRDYLKRLYASADLFLSPGPYETFGLATLEALSSGLPVAAANTGGAAELVTNCHGGMLFESNNPAAMVQTVDAMLCTDLIRMSKNAGTYARNEYSWNSTFDKMVAEYSRLIQGRKGRQFKVAS